MLLRAGTVLNDRYEILNTVGTGGMADVYRARDNVLKRAVAVKVLKEEYSTDAGFVAKFRREAQAAGGFSHPNIVSVYDVGDQNGMYYIVMELVEGITLKKYIEKTGRMPEREAVEVAMQVARGLEAAHEQGIIHRDVKPQNIIISREGKIKVADFGIARMSSKETISNTTMGSVHYISPEQARGGACDARSDIYSLGVTMFEMVTGQVPFDGENSVAVALKHVQDPMPSPRQIEPGISGNLEKIILKCTQKNPAYRYSSMAALLLDLRRLIVSPGEDFVVLHQEEENDPSLRMSKQDADILKVAGITSSGRDWMDAEQALLALEEGAPRAAAQQEEDRRAEAKAKRTEHILSYIMLGIAVLILVLIIAIAFKACALFGPTDPAVTTTAVPHVSRNTTAAPTDATTPSVPGSSAAASAAPTTTAPPSAETTTQDRPIETNPENTVVVPGFTGKSIEEARELAEDLGLGVSFETQYVQNDTEPVIVDQNYPEGTVVLLGTEITLWIAVKEDTSVYVPTTIVGKSVSDASKILADAGLTVSPNAEWKASQMIEYGKVIDCKPSMGSQVERGSKIVLIISSGPATVKMPDILGQTEEEAIATLKTAGFNTDTYVHFRTETVKDSKYDADTVAKIEATVSGSLKTVSPGASVDLRGHIYLSLAASDPELPKMTGRTDLEALLTELEELGLETEVIYETESSAPAGSVSSVTVPDPETEGAVIEAAAGMIVPKGSKLTIYVRAKQVPDGLIDKSVEEAAAILKAAGIEYSFKDGAAPEDPAEARVTAVSPAAGTALKDGDTVEITFSKEHVHSFTEASRTTTDFSEEDATTIYIYRITVIHYNACSCGETRPDEEKKELITTFPKETETTPEETTTAEPETTPEETTTAVPETTAAPENTAAPETTPEATTVTEPETTTAAPEPETTTAAAEETPAEAPENTPAAGD